MEKHQELEWNEAQNLSISVDLISAAKQHLRFLAAVDRNRWLYEGPALIRAIYRYNACWLPLLAKHSESQLIRGPLVVPLDCEWVWHCHRLSPVRYKSDCLEFYGTILDSHNVVSSIQGTPKTETEAIWNKLYPNEPYELDLTTIVPDDETVSVSGGEKFTKYDLVSAVKRQSPFFYQVSRPHMDHDLFLEGSVARYKGFLHLIKRNKEGSVKRFCVPTYDIDIIWHTHQLNPVSYCKDLVEILGTVLEHDDTDSDRTKGQKLDLGFSETTQQWEETFGLRYWRAGAMYRGSAPSPLTMTPWNPNNDSEKVVVMEEDQKFIQLPVVQVVEVMLEFVHVKNLPEAHKGATLIVSFSKTQPDTIFNVKRTLPILSKSGQKQVASFHCQPNGKLLFELSSNSKRSKPLGSASFSLDEFLSPLSNLSTEKWLELVPASGIVCSNPMFLRVAISFTIPTKATRVLQMIRPRLFLKRSCLFPLRGITQFGKSRTHVIDEDGNNIVSLQLRGFKKTKGETDAISRKEVVGITKSGETRTLAEFAEKWSLKNSEWSLQFPNITTKDGHFLELIGCRNVKLFRGRKLEYEPKHCEKQIREDDFITAVEFSAEDPYGRVVALLDLKYGTLTVKEEWVVLPVTTLGFLLFTVLRKEGYDGFIADMEVGKKSKVTSGAACGGGCGGGCGGCGGYGVKSGGCGGCGGGCGGCGGGVNNVKSGGCGGCGGGCGGNKVKSGGCGSGCGGCGGGCGNGLGCGNSKGGGDDVPKPVNQVVVA